MVYLFRLNWMILWVAPSNPFIIVSLSKEIMLGVAAPEIPGRIARDLLGILCGIL